MPSASCRWCSTSCARKSARTSCPNSKRLYAPEIPDMPSFDAVSELDTHELINAVDQANRELSQRFDFKDTGASFELKEKEFTASLKAPAESHLKQVGDNLTQRLGKRGIEARRMDNIEPVTNLAEARQDIVLRNSIDQETGKRRQKILKESKVEVQAQIQGNE